MKSSMTIHHTMNSTFTTSAAALAVLISGALSATVLAAPRQAAGAGAGGVEAPPIEVSPADEVSRLPALPETPASIESIVAARPFTVQQAWSSDWSADRPSVVGGWVVVVRVKHELAVPRQTQEPILFAGAMVAERLVSDPASNLIVAIIPATSATEAVPGLAARSAPTTPNSERSSSTDAGVEAGEPVTVRPLHETPFWFGTPGLPEQVDRAALSREIVLAERARIVAASKEATMQSLARGGAAIEALDRAALLEIVEPWARQLGVAFPDDQAAAAAPAAPKAPAGR